MSRLGEFLIRLSAFARKEIAAVLRQPRLVLILIMGPFLVLLLFGVGYTNSERALKTIIVAPEGSLLREQIEAYSDRLIGITVVEITEDAATAEDRLRSREVDLVLITPDDPMADIRSGKHAQLDFRHHEIDPLEQLYVQNLERAYVDFINRQVLTLAADRGKAQAASLKTKVDDALADAEALRTDLERGDGSAALRDADALATDVQLLVFALDEGLATFEGIESLEQAGNQDTAVSLFGSLAEVERLTASLELLNPDQGSYTAEVAQATVVVNELTRVETFLTEVQDLDSGVVARPFEGKVDNVNLVTLGPIDFYVPGVIALLLQHMAITLAALSIVREFRGGSMELFRAAPISAFETLAGKMISYLLFTAVLAAVLTLLVVLGLKTPMLGSWGVYAQIVAALLFTSLSMGFAISVISETDTQAVQYSMIVLLASIFFSGFFIALHRLAGFVQIVSWLLPATYGTSALQDVMLRGLPANPLVFTGLVVFGLLLFLFAWWRLHRQMRPQ